MLNRFYLIGFQEASSPIMEGIIDLHNSITFYLVLIFVFVFWIFVAILMSFYVVVEFPKDSADLNLRNFINEANDITHGTVIEIIWTIIPSLVLLLIAVPSFALLYAMDEVIEPAITLKAIGHQWYWSYEYSDFLTLEGSGDINFDSYMITEDDLLFGSFRLLEVDNYVVLPVDVHVRVIVTAGDVLHSWAIPALGAKVDAVPGRLNQLSIYAKREGVYYGQCSELCGVNHGFMPIVVKITTLNNFVEWINELKK
jgi:cytochrome c oxidase subunit 2